MNDKRDTIVAVATPGGTGGIGMVRMSGEESLNSLKKLFVPLDKDCPFENHKLYLGDIFTPQGDNIDRVFAVYMKAPKTYTGEDIVEITCHGGSSVATVIKDSFLELGIREALPGEFSKRAFYEGKIDLTEAEAINELSRSMTRLGASIASGVLHGELNQKFKDIKERMTNLLANVSALIDFEEDVSGSIDEKDVEIELSDLISNLSTLRKTYKNYLILSRGFRVVLVGQKNAGKTTLFNTLLGEQRGIVSDLPGTTRDWLEGTIEIDGYLIRLLDTAGLGDADNYIDFLGMEKTRELIETSDMLLFLIDCSTGFTKEDEKILENIRDKRYLIVMNKIDVVDDDEIYNMHNIISKFCDTIIPLSSMSGGNISELLSQIKHYISNYERDGTYIITERQFNLTTQILNNLKSAEEKLIGDYGIEEVSHFISQALYHLEEITGEHLSEDVINRIFENFCVGK